MLTIGVAPASPYKYRHAPQVIFRYRSIRKTLIGCYNRGARYLSLSSSGEPTLSPKSQTVALEIVHQLAEEGTKYEQVNMYTNGIRIGSDEYFCERYLKLWRDLGLTHFYITVHGAGEVKNAEVYRVPVYPPFEQVFSRVKQRGYVVRANIVLSQTIGGLKGFIDIVERLNSLGVSTITAWPMRDDNDEIDRINIIPENEMGAIVTWVKNSGYDIRIYSGCNDYHDKITLFQNGQLTNKWCNH